MRCSYSTLYPHSQRHGECLYVQGDSIDRETLIGGCKAISNGKQRVTEFITADECDHEWDDFSRFAPEVSVSLENWTVKAFC